MATTSVPGHLADPTKWTEFVPSYGVLQAATGGASTASAAECKDAIAAQSTRSPIVLAFVLQGDEDHIHIGHSATAFPRCIADPTCPFNGTMVVLVGADLVRTTWEVDLSAGGVC